MSSAPVVIIFARAPTPGRAKTRLIPALGPEAAAELYRCFLLDTLAGAAGLPADIVVAAAGEEDAPEVAALAARACPRARVTVQAGADLGARMHRAFMEAFAAGRPRAVILGADLPTLPMSRVRHALALLNDCGLVVGPCLDGGYYLVGLRGPQPGLFEPMGWGGSGVLAETLRRARATDLAVSLLEPWYDVDTPHDLTTLRLHLDALALVRSVPCLATWRYLREHPWRR